MRTKKLVAMGLLSAMVITTVGATSVFAAENAMDGTGATDITYTPGSSTGGDGDGNVSSWTIDYPVKIALSDATVDEGSAVSINFDVVNTSNGSPYDGRAQVQATLKSHTDKTTDGNSIKMQDTSKAAQANVTMQLKDEDSAIVKTDGTGEFATLSSTDRDYTLKAYLSDKSGAKTDQTYSTTLTWAFHSNQVN
nr:hypothetical protein [uncultured Mediterraneibacter sp.]